MAFDTPAKQVSYGIGRNFGEQLLQQPFEGMDADSLAAGLKDVLNQQASQVAEADLEAAFQVIQQQMQAEAAEQAKQAEGVGLAFLEENAQKDNIITLESGLQYEILVEGSGDKPAETDTVSTHYHGTLIDGSVFDSSVERGQPAQFPVNRVIAGWTEALQLMPVGSKWRLFIPHDLAYGPQGSGGKIPPYSALVFEVELLEIV